MKKLMFNFLLFFSISNIISCCTNQKNKDNEQIKNTVNQYFKAIKNNNSADYNNIVSDSQELPGATASDLFFLHKNYSKINPNNILLKNIKVKDTFNAGTQKKYVMFILKKPNYKPFETNQDLKMYLMFWKNTGYDKIDQVFIIGNMPKWEDQKPIDLSK
ncbi:hypothetical protein [Epilithonimonas vandammei]|uniref:Uncharacterized protein n=1 Tax=Epilithonimonas vandammei TaxID=2487072 RepID=A0A3G8Y719_9FLAO|nr:hypothetical protein [Epilithonimonas vandammei]AZI41148.1 hypothetical protein EIB74_14840 [Epilithonimonas vandammei]